MDMTLSLFYLIPKYYIDFGLLVTMIFLSQTWENIPGGDAQIQRVL